MTPYFGSTVPVDRIDRMVMLASMCVLLAAIAAVDTSFLLAAASIITVTTAEKVMCLCIALRTALLYTRCTAVLLYDDERSTAMAMFASERLRLQRTHEEARLQLYRVVFHELRVPLNSIVLGLDLVSASSGTADAAADSHDTVAMMREASDRMMTILSDLLDIAKIEARAFDLKLAPMRVAGLLEQTVREMTPFARAKRIAITYVIVP